MEPQEITQELKLWNLQNNISGFVPLSTVPKVEYFMPEIKDTAVADYAKETFNTRAHNMGTPKSIEQSNEQLKQKILACLDRLSIYLRAGETLTLSLGSDRSIHVTGLYDLTKARDLENEFNTVKKPNASGVRENPYIHHFYLNSAYAKEAQNYGEANRRANLIKLKDTARQAILEQTGQNADITQLYKTKNGQIEGYPPSLARLFNKEDESSATDAPEAYRPGAALALENTIRLLLDAGCEGIPDADKINVTFEYTYKDFLDFEVNG